MSNRKCVLWNNEPDHSLILLIKGESLPKHGPSTWETEGEGS